jgi:protein SCO1
VKWFGLIFLATMVACKPQKPVQEMRGVELPKPIPRPSFVLEDTEGKPFDFRARTGGKLTFLMFGYTNCPDVCPVHMSGLAAALKKLSYDDRQKIDVVFITTDPVRDSQEKLREWLNEADHSFIGLRGPDSIVADAQKQIGVVPAFASEPDSQGKYDVGHASSIYVFTPDDSARRAYPFGIRQSDWAHDLPKLLEL